MLWLKRSCCSDILVKLSCRTKLHKTKFILIEKELPFVQQGWLSQQSDSGLDGPRLRMFAPSSWIRRSHKLDSVAPQNWNCSFVNQSKRITFSPPVVCYLIFYVRLLWSKPRLWPIWSTIVLNINFQAWINIPSIHILLGINKKKSQFVPIIQAMNKKER